MTGHGAPPPAAPARWIGAPADGVAGGRYTSCIDLNTAKDDLPEELEQGDFVCLAFPQATLLHRLVVVLIMISCLVPVQSLLGAIFQTPPAFTRFFTPKETKEHAVKTLNKRGLNGLFQVPPQPPPPTVRIRLGRAAGEGRGDPSLGQGGRGRQRRAELSARSSVRWSMS